MRKRLLYFAWLLLAGMGCIAQTYHTNGNAYSENCNCYTLTDAQGNQAGSVWNKNQINLSQSFDYKFDVNLGSNDGDGADGMVFVLQNISLSIGSTGEGMGFGGVSPSVGILIDTYQNGNQNDPSYDHISINRDGDINHSSVNNLDGPVSALQGRDNIEDGQFHSLRIIWNATTKVLKAQVDGVDRVQATIDMVASVFSNNPIVFWGFTAATGGSFNRQRFCTSLTPVFNMPANQVTCFPTPVSFIDNSVSFGTILDWHWNFGDGTTASGNAPAPHVFPQPGIYEVKLTITGNNGCESDTFRQSIIIGSQPVAGFGVPPPPVCDEGPVVFTDTSKVTFGSITSWIWTVDNNAPVVIGTGGVFKQDLLYGAHPVSLQVKTKEGCVSPIASNSVTIYPRPSVTMSFANACKGDEVTFTAANDDASVPVRTYNWNFADGSTGSGITAAHTYTKRDTFTIQLYAEADNGCVSAPIKKDLIIYGTNAFAGNDTLVISNLPLQLNGTGGYEYSWSPATGLSDPSIANPVVVLEKSGTYVLTASSPLGCETTDTINIKVMKGPAIYVPNAFSPNGDGINDRFRVTPVGITNIYYFRIFNRYGQLVFNASNTKDGWDGTISGKQQGSGTYVWMVKGKDFTGRVHEERGTLQLVR